MKDDWKDILCMPLFIVCFTVFVLQWLHWLPIFIVGCIFVRPTADRFNKIFDVFWFSMVTLYLIDSAFALKVALERWSYTGSLGKALNAIRYADHFEHMILGYMPYIIAWILIVFMILLWIYSKFVPEKTTEQKDKNWLPDPLRKNIIILSFGIAICLAYIDPIIYK